MSLKPNQIIDIKPYGSNIKYYESLGYKFSKWDIIQVPAELLPIRKGTHSYTEIILKDYNNN